MKCAESMAVNRSTAGGEVEAGNVTLTIKGMQTNSQKWTDAGGQVAMDSRAVGRTGQLDAAWEHTI